MKITKRIENRVNKVNEAIARLIEADISAVECESTFESAFKIEPLTVNKTSVTFKSSAYDFARCKTVKETITIRNDEDFRYYMSYILKCIKKGFKEEGLQLEAERKEEEEREAELLAEDLAEMTSSRSEMTDCNGLVWQYYAIYSRRANRHEKKYVKTVLAISRKRAVESVSCGSDGLFFSASVLMIDEGIKRRLWDAWKAEMKQRRLLKKLKNEAIDTYFMQPMQEAGLQDEVLVEGDLYDIMQDFNSRFNWNLSLGKDIKLETLHHWLTLNNKVEAFKKYVPEWYNYINNDIDLELIQIYDPSTSPASSSDEPKKKSIHRRARMTESSFERAVRLQEAVTKKINEAAATISDEELDSINPNS
jgi:hypothetical protein